MQIGAGKKIQKEHGSATLEATLFLTMFILFYIALMDIAQLSTLQSVLQYACTESAKEISQGTYILSKAGIVSRISNTNKNRKEFEGDVGELVDNVSELADGLNKGSLNMNQLDVTISNAEEFFSNSDDIVQGLVSLVRSAGRDIVGDVVVSAMTKGLVKKQIKNMSSADPDVFLKRHGIEDGVAGLDFRESQWLASDSNDTQEIKIVCSYSVNYKVGFLELGERRFKVCARTAVW